MKVKFTSNPYIKASWHEATAKLTKLTNEYLDEAGSSGDLLKKAEDVLYRLGWTLEEYQELNRPPTKRHK
jgi:hypothetical protein